MAKKFFKVCLAIVVMLILLTSSVLATTGTVTGSTVRIREKADSKSPEVSAATKGEKVEIIGEEGNWYKVKFEKITGYISKDYVDTDYSSGSSTSTTTTTQESEASNEIVQEPEPETPVETTQESEKVGETEEITQEQENPTETQTNVTATIKTRDYSENQTVNFKNDTTLRYLPNFSSRSQGTVSSDSTYIIKASLNNWVKVSNDTNSGWVLKNTIEVSSTDNVVPEDNSSQNNDKDSSDNTTSDTSTDVTQTSKGKVNVDSARIRKSPDGDVLDSLSKGTEVTILAEEDGWYKISTEKYDSCYIAKRLITEN